MKDECRRYLVRLRSPLHRQAKAKEISAGKATVLEKLESLFLFVRDEDKFGFPPRWDEVKASETIRYGLGYCNTKATLFLALCKAINIPARIHTGLIDIEVMRGVLPSFIFPLLAKFRVTFMAGNSDCRRLETR